MSRIDNVINDVIKKREGKNRPWIYDENGNIADNVIIADIIPFLEELKDYEINVNDDYINNFLAEKNVRSFNTYNYNGKVTNDFCFHILDIGSGENIIVIAVHLAGDIRTNYSDYFAVKIPEYDFFSLESARQSVSINDRYVADVDIFSEEYSVYDYDTCNDVGYFYDIEKEELLKELKKAE